MKNQNDYSTFVGLDVHAEKIAVAVGRKGRKEVEELGNIGNEVKSLNRLLKKFPDGKRTLFTYEAGACGYGLYRYLTSRGYGCEVIAPSLIPRKPGNRVKTDRRDAKQLAELNRAGLLTAVWVPDEKQESIRDLIRGREDVVRALRRAKQNVNSFLQRYERRYAGRSKWTKKYWDWLRSQKFSYRWQQVAYEEYLETVEHAGKKIERLEQEMRIVFETWELRPVAEGLMALKGVDFVVAMSTLAELGDLRRFETPNQLMSYLGLVPSECSSGDNHHRYRITRAGNSYVRSLLIEAAWSNTTMPRKTGHWKRKAAKASQEVQGIAWEAQKRLHQRYWSLVNRKKRTTKAIVAVARELSAFIWAIAQQVHLEQRAQAV